MNIVRRITQKLRLSIWFAYSEIFDLLLKVILNFKNNCEPELRWINKVVRQQWLLTELINTDTKLQLKSPGGNIQK